MAKPTVHDISAHSGLSTATVDRVLNDRSGVSQRARDKVAAAVRELGYGKLPDSLSTEVRNRLKFLFLIPTRRSGFVRNLEMAIKTAGHDAISLTGPQVGIKTDRSHTKARIESICARRIRKALAENKIDYLERVGSKSYFSIGFGKGHGRFGFCLGRKNFRVELYFPDDPEKILFDGFSVCWQSCWCFRANV